MGYAGTLHSARLDVALLVRSAELRPQWEFILVGPDHLEAPDRMRLFRLPNVHHLGVRPHSAVSSYVSGFDVCLMPNLITDFTRSLNPLKLYEYLAAGRPVVATAAGIPTELEEHVMMVSTAEDLVRAAERGLGEDDPARVASRRASIAGETWESRAAEIERALGVQPQAPRSDEVSVVIATFNTKSLLERCLVALQDQEDVNLQMIVVDNASRDGSGAMVRDRFPSVELLELSENLGFARANNLAFERCRGRYVVLLNSDALLHPRALRELVAAAERHPSAGAVGPRLFSPDGNLQRSAWPFPRAGRILLEAFALHRPLRRLGMLDDLGVWEHDEERAVDFLIGACLLLRTDALAEVEGFDEGFWLYGEEADLQRRLASRGWSVIFTPRAAATHVGGASSKEQAPRLRHFYAGQRRFLEKHGGPGAWPIARLALVIGSLLRRRWSAAWVGIEGCR
jgi:GT2 family glycosyltransferase